MSKNQEIQFNLEVSDNLGWDKKNLFEEKLLILTVKFNEESYETRFLEMDSRVRFVFALDGVVMDILSEIGILADSKGVRSIVIGLVDNGHYETNCY